MELLKRLVDLAILMSKEQREQAISLLDEIKDKVPAEAKDIVKNLRKFIESYQWDDAWNEYEALAAIVQKYDPPQEGLEVGGTPQAKLEALLESLARISDILVSVYDIEIKGIEEAKTEIEDAIEDIEKHIRFLGIYDEVATSFGEVKSAFERGDWNTLVYTSSKLAWRIVGRAPTIEEILRDPVLSTWVSEETYKGYKERAKYYGETLSSDVREVIEGRRTPWVPSDGVKAAKRIEKMAKEEKADWEKRIEEALKPEKAEWEKDLNKILNSEQGANPKLVPIRVAFNSDWIEKVYGIDIYDFYEAPDFTIETKAHYVALRFPNPDDPDMPMFITIPKEVPKELIKAIADYCIKYWLLHEHYYMIPKEDWLPGTEEEVKALQLFLQHAPIRLRYRERIPKEDAEEWLLEIRE